MPILKRKEEKQEKQEGLSGIAYSVAIKETPVQPEDSKTLQRSEEIKAERCGRIRK